MEFWGVEVKAGVKTTVRPEYEQMIHITQATLERLPVKDSIRLAIEITNKDGSESFMIGHLTANRPQLLVDLVVEREFCLSHNCKHGSVFFVGYTTAVEPKCNASTNPVPPLPGYEYESEKDTPEDKMSKKREGSDSAEKTPLAKKVKAAKNVTPGAAISPGMNFNKKSPESAGSVPCMECERTFSSSFAMEMHFNAKHRGKGHHRGK